MLLFLSFPVEVPENWVNSELFFISSSKALHAFGFNLQGSRIFWRSFWASTSRWRHYSGQMMKAADIRLQDDPRLMSLSVVARRQGEGFRKCFTVIGIVISNDVAWFFVVSKNYPFLFYTLLWEVLVSIRLFCYILEMASVIWFESLDELHCFKIVNTWSFDTFTAFVFCYRGIPKLMLLTVKLEAIYFNMLA